MRSCQWPFSRRSLLISSFRSRILNSPRPAANWTKCTLPSLLLPLLPLPPLLEGLTGAWDKALAVNDYPVFYAEIPMMMLPNLNACNTVCSAGSISHEAQRLTAMLKQNGLRWQSIDQYTSARKVVCDLDLWTYDLQNVISVMWTW